MICFFIIKFWVCFFFKCFLLILNNVKLFLVCLTLSLLFKAVVKLVVWWTAACT